MLIITLRTDKPEAEIGLFEGGGKLAYESWPAHRQLAETIHLKIRGLLHTHGYRLQQVSGIILYRGPGSFTGLRIGTAVANALAADLPAAIIGSSGSDWRAQGIERLGKGENDKLVIPEYGSPARTTQQKK